jgi:hypothetical protein
MPNFRINQTDAFVLLESGRDEQFLTPDEMLAKLKAVVTQYPNSLPRDAQKFDSTDEQAQYLLETSCELSPTPGYSMQWYAVRLEK